VQEQEFPGEEPDKLALWDVDDAYQIFADGSLIGTFDIFRRGKAPVTYWNEPEMFDLLKLGTNDSPSIVTVTHILAFRVWCDPNTLNQNPDGCGLHVAPVMGNAAAVGAEYQRAWIEIIKSYGATAAEALIYFVLAIAAGALVFFDHSDRVYLWLAGVFLLTAANAACMCVFAWTMVANQATIYLTTDALLGPFILGGWVMTWWFWFRLRRPPWVPKVVVGLTVLYGLSNALVEDLFYTLIPHAVSAAFHLVAIGIRLSFLSLLVLIVVQGIRQQGREGWLTLPAVVLVGIAQFQIDLLVLHIPTVWYPFGVGVGLSDLANAVLSAIIFVLLLRRLQQSLHHQRLIALDVKQAQEVQQVILPEARIVLPGLVVESEYHPAREVGGDFFQIIPHPADGSVLIVAGDVTGKGLKAGMLVALLVGAVRTAADTNSAPELVLRVLNKRLVGRSDAQATCLALRIEADGSVTLANAGHMPPYLNGEPMKMEGALPLGMMEGAELSAMRFRLSEGDRLMLLSDGIAEATDANGELFGFERVHELLRTASSAAEVASAAQQFGQEDDISVISVTLTEVLTPIMA
jgi:sulfur transfer complex TusBCD TusB component (DsrH family)